MFHLLSPANPENFRPDKGRDVKWRMRSANNRHSRLQFTISAWQTKIFYNKALHFDENVWEREKERKVPLFHHPRCPKACARKSSSWRRFSGHGKLGFTIDETQTENAKRFSLWLIYNIITLFMRTTWVHKFDMKVSCVLGWGKAVCGPFWIVFLSGN